MSNTTDFIMLKNVRVSFPHLFQEPIINGQKGKRGAAFMLDPEAHKNELRIITEAMQVLAQDAWKGKMPPSDKLCLRKGEDKGREEYVGCVVLSTNTTGKPFVLNAALKQIEDEEDNPIYGGCYVNAKVRLWAQDNKYGKRINGELIAIQFAGDGDPFDGRHVRAEDAMDGFDASNDNTDLTALFA